MTPHQIRDAGQPFLLIDTNGDDISQRVFVASPRLPRPHHSRTVRVTALSKKRSAPPIASPRRVCSPTSSAVVFFAEASGLVQDAVERLPAQAMLNRVCLDQPPVSRISRWTSGEVRVSTTWDHLGGPIHRKAISKWAASGVPSHDCAGRCPSLTHLDVIAERCRLSVDRAVFRWMSSRAGFVRAARSHRPPALAPAHVGRPARAAPAARLVRARPAERRRRRS